MCWVKYDDPYQDEAEEALNMHHDRRIEEFYLEVRDRVRSLRMRELEEGIILNIKENTS